MLAQAYLSAKINKPRREGAANIAVAAFGSEVVLEEEEAESKSITRSLHVDKQ